jgi:uncharacterized paraquat-inducible protein A
MSALKLENGAAASNNTTPVINDRLDTILSYFSCPKCDCYFRQPYLCKKGHTFCGFCYEEIRQE